MIKIIFRHIAEQDLALAEGEFPFWPAGNEGSIPRFARVEVTGGGLDDPRKRRIAAEVGSALVRTGVPEESISMIFRPVDPKDIFAGRGRSPFD